MKPVAFPRRDLLKAGGALLIGFAIRDTARAQTPEGVAFVTGPDQPDPIRRGERLAQRRCGTARARARPSQRIGHTAADDTAAVCTATARLVSSS